LLPVISAILTAAVLAAAWWIFLVPETRRRVEETTSDNKTSAEHLQQAGVLLAGGMFRLAAQELHGEPTDLTTEEKRRWRHLRREASLFADLCTEPLEDILQHAAGVPEREWQADFPVRYQGKSILFDTTVQRRADGKLRVLYVFSRPDARLHVDDLELFRNLPLDQPRRVLFGVRLAGINLEPPGPVWVVRFQTDSGVFLTDGKATGLCCPGLNEPDVLRILDEQAKLTP
jgi:hypothetical protein